MLCQKESSGLAVQGPVWAGAISHSLHYLSLFGPQAQAGPGLRTGHNSKERKLPSGSQERLKLKLQLQQAYSVQELKAWLPNRLHALSKNMGSEELSWGSRNVRVKITSMQRTTGCKLDGHRYH